MSLKCSRCSEFQFKKLSDFGYSTRIAGGIVAASRIHETVLYHWCTHRSVSQNKRMLSCT